ncbi:MAG: polysaccharide deacetylase family protein [Gemmatimonadetes bacterium]|nr:polysaccharide deacetylase family protein [Gemmatimonadota bacterium]
MTDPNPFQWPLGKKAAVSLTFDDARLSQIDVGIPLLNQFGLKGTFFVSLTAMLKRLDGWRAAVRAGHEVGNHTVKHPCTGNFHWCAQTALEDYTLDQMAAELDEANAQIEKQIGIRPQSFAYPCGQTFVGCGVNTRSYVPLVAERFLVGRGFSLKVPNNPWRCDLAQVMGVDFDCQPIEEIQRQIEQARASGSWIVFAGHEMGATQSQSVSEAVLTPLCRYLTESADLWVDTTANIGAYVAEARRTTGLTEVRDGKPGNATK